MVELTSIAATTWLKRTTETARSILRAALDLALPRLCPACRAPVEGQGLCPGCWSKLSFISRPYCERLGIPFVYDPGPGILSMEAIAAPRPIGAPVPQYVSMRFHAPWCMPSNMATASISRR